MEIKRELEREEGGMEEEGLITEIKWGEERWKVGVVYVREKMRKILEKIKMEA